MSQLLDNDHIIFIYGSDKILAVTAKVRPGQLQHVIVLAIAGLYDQDRPRDSAS